MNALVNRGAPRDLLDIKRVCDEGLIAPGICWDLWARKNAGQHIGEAKEKVLRHLCGLDARRPLQSIVDADERTAAQRTREWFRQVFLAR